MRAESMPTSFYELGSRNQNSVLSLVMSRRSVLKLSHVVPVPCSSPRMNTCCFGRGLRMRCGDASPCSARQSSKSPMRGG